jgi:hypothetical protein
MIDVQDVGHHTRPTRLPDVNALGRGTNANDRSDEALFDDVVNAFHWAA